MERARRAFLGAIVPAVLLAGVAKAGLAQRGVPKTIPEPPTKDVFKADTRLTLKQQHEETQRDAQRLFELAEELKKEVEKTDATEVLSLAIIRKAEEIEKLAKRIKNRARG